MNIFMSETIKNWKEEVKKLLESQQGDKGFGAGILALLILLGAAVFFSGFRFVSIIDTTARFVLGAGVVIFSVAFLRKEIKEGDNTTGNGK